VAGSVLSYEAREISVPGDYGSCGVAEEIKIHSRPAFNFLMIRQVCFTLQNTATFVFSLHLMQSVITHKGAVSS